MKTSITFKGASKPFGASGHFHEPMRHALQARGIRTGTHLNAGYASLKPFKTVKYNDQDFHPFSDGLAYYKGKMYGTKEDLKYMPKKVRLIDFEKDTDKDKVPDSMDCQPYNANAQDAPKSFKIAPNIEIVAEYKDARDGFNHVATLYVDSVKVDTAKAHYINRTWESYDFQSVMQQLVNKTRELTADQKKMALDYLAKDHTDWSDFKNTAMIAKLGDIMTSSKKESNDWKARMLKAGLGGKGLEMPEDWDKLDEDTKQKRLDAVIAQVAKTPEKHEEAGSPPEASEHEYELPVQYDARKSFYGKAQVRGEGNKTILRSYNTDVAYIEGGKAHVNGTYSPTTLRHIKEFLKQNGFEAETSKQIIKDYGE